MAGYTYGHLGMMTADEMRSARRILRYLALAIWDDLHRQPHRYTARYQYLFDLLMVYNDAAYTLDLVRDDFRF